MALKRILGMDCYSNTWNDLPTSGAIRRLSTGTTRSFTSSGTRFSYGKKLVSTGAGLAAQGRGLGINIGSFSGNLIQGFAFKWDGDLANGNGVPLCDICNVNGSQIAGLDLSNLGYLRAWGGAGVGPRDAPLVASAVSSPFGAGDESYIEYEVGAAVFKVWRNGELLIDFAGAIPTDGADAAWASGAVDCILTEGGQIGNGLIPTTPGSVSGSSFDDYYLLDTGGGGRNARLGDSRSEFFVLDTAVANTGYGATGGTNIEDRLNTNDADTSKYDADADNDIFVASSNDTLTNTPVAIHGIGLSHVSKKTQAANTRVKSILRIGGTDYKNAGDLMAAAYGQYQTIYETDPDAVADFTKSSLEAIDGFGFTIDQP